jgi:nucleoside-diphosphate-sugar epimerase
LPLQVFGGRQVLDFVWIDLVVSAILKAAELPDWAGPVNIGGGRGVPILTLAERLIEVTGTRSTSELLPARQEEVVGFTADVTKMRTLLQLDPAEDPLHYLSTMAVAVSEA